MGEELRVTLEAGCSSRGVGGFSFLGRWAERWLQREFGFLVSLGSILHGSFCSPTILIRKEIVGQWKYMERTDSRLEFEDVMGGELKSWNVFLMIFLPTRVYTKREDYGRLGSKASVLPSRVAVVSILYRCCQITYHSPS